MSHTPSPAEVVPNCSHRHSSEPAPPGSSTSSTPPGLSAVSTPPNEHQQEQLQQPTAAAVVIPKPLISTYATFMHHDDKSFLPSGSYCKDLNQQRLSQSAWLTKQRVCGKEALLINVLLSHYVKPGSLLGNLTPNHQCDNNNRSGGGELRLDGSGGPNVAIVMSMYKSIHLVGLDIRAALGPVIKTCGYPTYDWDAVNNMGDGNKTGLTESDVVAGEDATRDTVLSYAELRSSPERKTSLVARAMSGQLKPQDFFAAFGNGGDYPQFHGPLEGVNDPQSTSLVGFTALAMCIARCGHEDWLICNLGLHLLHEKRMREEVKDRENENQSTRVTELSVDEEDSNKSGQTLVDVLGENLQPKEEENTNDGITPYDFAPLAAKYRKTLHNELSWGGDQAQLRHSNFRDFKDCPEALIEILSKKDGGQQHPSRFLQPRHYSCLLLVAFWCGLGHMFNSLMTENHITQFLSFGWLDHCTRVPNPLPLVTIKRLCELYSVVQLSSEDSNVLKAVESQHQTAFHTSTLFIQADAVKVLLQAGARPPESKGNKVAVNCKHAVNDEDVQSVIYSLSEYGISINDESFENLLLYGTPSMVRNLFFLEKKLREDKFHQEKQRCLITGDTFEEEMYLTAANAIDDKWMSSAFLGIQNKKQILLPPAASSNHGNSQRRRRTYDFEMVELLLNHCYADANLIASSTNAGTKSAVKETPKLEGHTLLTYAASRGDAALVKLLLSKPGVNVHHRVKNGMTALSYAASYGYPDICTMLLEEGNADVDDFDDEGNTALHYASKDGWRQVVRCLRRAGILEHIPNYNGQTAFDLARSNGFGFLFEEE